MIINRSNLQGLTTGFRANFQGGFAGVAPQWTTVATLVPSSTSENAYPWLGEFPGMREWLGDRVVKNIETHGYSIKNKPFEMTVSVPAPAIEDDQYGVYAPMMTEMGRAAAAHPDELVFGLLKNAFATNCYDGQYFFDTDHPVLAPDGTLQSVSNYQSGSSSPWFLIDDSRALKPLIFQQRKKPNFVAKDRPEDDNVFDSAVFKYGVDSRCNVGFGFWQLAQGSKATLTTENFDAAYDAMAGRKGDQGRPLGVMARKLIVGPGNRKAGQDIVKAVNLANGATNTNVGLVDLVIVPWLA